MDKEVVIQTRVDNAASFMAFVSLGITNIDENVISVCVDRAYRDAACRVLSTTDYRSKVNAGENGGNLITDAIDSLSGCKDDYDRWHRELCDGLIEIYKHVDQDYRYRFTYGIAQNWVNMTMKYLYIVYYFCVAIGYEDTLFQQKYGKMIEKYVSDFHVPVDSVIIRAAKKELGVSAGFRSWTKLNNYGDYYAFVTAVRNHGIFNIDTAGDIRYSPIDWENPAWIRNVQEQ